MVIPKIIHYCWFGGAQKPEDVQRYITTRRELCPDYEIKEWNESNFDVTQNDYCREAYEAKKWAFVTDYARLRVLLECGGIYMDADVEVIKPFDDLLEYEAFSGYESTSDIPTGTLAASKGNEWIDMLLRDYDHRHFIGKDGEYDLTTNVAVITRLTKERYGLHLDGERLVFGNGILLLPFDYLCAKDWRTGELYRTEHTYTIHHFAGSWLPPKLTRWEKWCKKARRIGSRLHLCQAL